MSRPTLAVVAALVVATCGLAAFLVLGSTADTETVSASGAVGSARNQPITGKLSKRGYTVIALAKSGEAKTDEAPNGKFRLRPPAKKVTLHLRASDGTYAGPIVVAGTWNLVKVAKKKLRRAERKLRRAKALADKASGKKAVRKAKRKVRAARKRVKQARRELKTARRRASGKEAVLGVTHGAALGAVSVKGSAGYAKAKLKLRQWKRWVVEENRARAKKGAPIGAGNFGRVRSKNTRGGAPGDLDLDGVANPLDIDDDGDLVLDNIDATPTGSAARGSQFASGAFPLSSRMHAGNKPDNETIPGPPGGNLPVNANAPGLSDAQIEAALPGYGLLALESDPTLGSAELDCGLPQDGADPGLIYCTAGGTGKLHNAHGAYGAPFPGEPFGPYDPDGDGLGTLPGYSFGYYHGATSDQIKSGDVLIQRIERTDGSEEELVAALQYVFETTPALASYDDGQGNSQTIPYPVTLDQRPPIKAGPSGDVVVELTLWRPQRRPIPPESGEWIDIGGLDYYIAAFPEGVFGRFCAQDSLSSSDPNLALHEISGDYGPTGGAFEDLVGDRPASPANTITFQANLTECFDQTGVPLVPGNGIQIELGATTGTGSEYRSVDLTSQRLVFEVVP